ncbi:hypothetical protein [Variovorax sp. HJSM1_2]|uniref:hypothetical protein n=1 Tax=Variovorax sp. HJSM1_2 TaxID=3366263 RepID=UPI003BEB4EB3
MRTSKPHQFPIPSLALALLGASFGLAQAQDVRSPVCASDGQPTPAVLVERFISADCEKCWGAPSPAVTAKLPARALALDWITPSPQGDEAPLSAAALRDADTRLQTLGQNRPPSDEALLLQRPVQTPKSWAAPGASNPAKTPPAKLRVAHGLALGGYIGASIELKPLPALPKKPVETTAEHRAAPWTAWLVLTESVPAGAEGSPIERRLARNALVLDWAPENAEKAKDANGVVAKSAVLRLIESRPLNVPTGANPDRLGVVGWVQDAEGRVLAAAASRCK